MKKVKTQTLNSNKYFIEGYDEADDMQALVLRSKIDAPKKRPLKNFKKAWFEHVEDFDEVEDFYGR